MLLIFNFYFFAFNCVLVGTSAKVAAVLIHVSVMRKLKKIIKKQE